jgi:metallo-beta-lactamase family protein
VISVHARVEKIDSMSAHADSQEILRWLGGFTRPPRMTFLVHGELVAMEALQSAIKAKLGWNTKLPQHEETVELS